MERGVWPWQCAIARVLPSSAQATDERFGEFRDISLSFERAMANLPRHTMDAIAKTNVCKSPLSQSSDDTALAVGASAYLIMVCGGIPGTMLRLGDDDTLLGRSTECTFQFYDGTVSRRHALVSIDTRGEVYLCDLGSTNGSFVNGKRIGSNRPVRLQDGDRFQLGTSVVLKLVRLDPNDEEFQRVLFERTVRDALTGLYNRGFFLSQIRALAARSAALEMGLAVLMLDVDHFKAVNDCHGHEAGDVVLKSVASVLRESTRAEDLVARYGGEEFVVALPVSAPDLACDRAERIRHNLAQRVIYAGRTQVRVTASVGLAFGAPSRVRDEMALIRMADEALYQAKAAGRNRVIFGHLDVSLVCPTTDSAEFVAVR
jgi:diguanylate cyclase (GGDEF)-like protein